MKCLAGKTRERAGYIEVVAVEDLKGGGGGGGGGKKNSMLIFQEIVQQNIAS